MTTTEDTRGLTAKYSDYISKFDSPMACYVYEQMLQGNDGDDSVSDPDGSGRWAERYGKRVLHGDSNGFVGLANDVTEADWAEWVRDIAPVEDDDE